MRHPVDALRQAYHDGDTAAVVALLHPEIRFISPISQRLVFRGPEDVGVLVQAVLETLDDLAWEKPLGSGDRWVLVGQAELGRQRITDAMTVRLGSDGSITELGPHLRPLVPVAVFAMVLAVRLLRHPGVLWRARRPT